MICERIQHLLLTDYFDGEAADEQKKLIEQHLSECPACQEFADLARNTAVTPFAGAPKPKLPQEKIWQNIKGKIEEDQESSTQAEPIGDWWEKLKGLIAVPRPVLVPAFAIVIVAAAVVVFSVTRQTSQIAKEETAQEAAEYLVYLADDETGMLVMGAIDDDVEDYGTDIEEYFL